jgi:branched-chain amino acid transport system permease protein
MSLFLQQLINGLAFASLLFLVSIGFSLIFGLMRIMNVAHGSFYVLGALVGSSVLGLTGNFLLAAVAGGLAGATLGVGLEKLLLSRFHGNEEKQVLLTLPLWFLLDDVWLWIWGAYPRTLPAPEGLRGPMTLLGATFPIYKLALMAVGVLVALGMWVLIERTKIGAIIRAGADNEEIARAMGINVDRTFIFAFALGTFLAGLAGVLGGPEMGVQLSLSQTILPLTLVVVIVGGLGTLKGAVAGSLFVGLVNTFGIALFPELSYFVLFVPMAVVLAIRPHGLFGRD